MYVASVNELSATTTPLNYPFSDGMADLSQWIASGAWGLTTNTAHGGPGCLTDSPDGNYTADGDDSAQTSLDLRLASWPVLRFWDRYAVSGYSRAAVEVSGTSMYIVNGTRPEWNEQAVDLSWWAGQANVPVKYRLRRWSGERADGWYVDDVSVAEHVPVPLSYPFFENFESGLANWLPGPWHVATDYQKDGASSMFNRFTDSSNVSGQNPMLSLGGWLDLTNAVNPQLVFWFRGDPSYYHRLGAQVYAQGSGWATVFDNYNAGYEGSRDWTRIQLSLGAYVNRKIRLNFYTSGNPNVWIDKVGVGGIMPGAPTFVGPPQTGYVMELRPTLTVGNAVHAENFLLTYQFEVYSDSGLANRVAQVPMVASGVDTTSWPVDINLADNAQYWWRCRAWYGTNAGPWMATATFRVNAGGSPPLAVMLEAPSDGAQVPNADTVFSWSAGEDPDAGDWIQAYEFAVDNDPAFGSPEIYNTLLMAAPVTPGPFVSIAAPLNQFAGYQSLQSGTRYYWRVRSRDGHGLFGPWSGENRSFVFGSAEPPVPPVISAFTASGGGGFVLQWTGPSNNVYVDSTTNLSVSPIPWTPFAGPLSGSSYIIPATNWPCGFYRVRTQ